MLDPNHLDQRLRQGEDSHTEFKSVSRSNFTIESAALGREVAALANSGGGEIFLGVDDDGTVSGTGDTAQTDALMRLVDQACLGTVSPPVFCRIIKAESASQRLLVVEVPGFGPNRPYRAKGRVYVRGGSQTREATQEELVRILQSADYHFDAQPVTGSTIEDLDLAAVDAYAAGAFGRPVPAEHRPKLLRELKCLDRDGVPTVAGILIFGKSPEAWLPDARVTCVRFPGTGIGSEFADRKEIGGPLPRQIDEAYAFLVRHVPSPSVLEGTTRTNKGVPAGVFREAVANAIAHRDYRPASQTRIFVFDDRFEVMNPGILLNMLTVESIRLGIVTQRRNPVIASLLNRLARRESLGIGIPEMIASLRDRGFPEPEFSVEGGFFRLAIQTRIQDTP